ncbi:hypothetical protein [Bacillus sp. 1NLA3E]|uniref:hypothetical protein n=1 Tax=Bacillus sp. 1NLA3E TaxID=666686 RepID=UPI000247E483|nr:hypothetical protein [Bacillus sp. 1NLA3E]AGK55968.1 hypothetical protein B1NLA3E_21150 [Bacillus sp. 1NLA3E]
MQIFSTFEHTIFLELAISSIEQKGVKKEDIFAVPLNNRVEERKLFDSLHHADGTSLIDLAMALATVFAVIGASFGFTLKWGPIYWGLIGTFFGFMLGFGIKLFIFKVLRKKKRLLKGKHGEVILIIDCHENKAEAIEQILWDHLALGVAKIQTST